MAPDFLLNGPRSSDDRATIVRGSWFFVDLDPPSDEDPMEAHDRPSDGDQTVPSHARVSTVSRSLDELRPSDVELKSPAKPRVAPR